MASEYLRRREQERIDSLEAILADERSYEEIMEDWITDVREYNLNPERPTLKKVEEFKAEKKARREARRLERLSQGLPEYPPEDRFFHSEYLINKERERMLELDMILADERTYGERMEDWTTDVIQYNLNPERPTLKKVEEWVSENEAYKQAKVEIKAIEAKEEARKEIVRKAISLNEVRKQKQSKNIMQSKIKNIMQYKKEIQSKLKNFFNFGYKVSYLTLIFLLTLAPSINSGTRVPLIAFNDNPRSEINVVPTNIAHAITLADIGKEQEEEFIKNDIEIPIIKEVSSINIIEQNLTKDNIPLSQNNTVDNIGSTIFKFVNLYNEFNYNYRDISI